MPAKARIKPSAELRALKARCGVFNPTFLAMDANQNLPVNQYVTTEQAAAVSKALAAQFDEWWNSWVEPQLEYLARRNF